MFIKLVGNTPSATITNKKKFLFFNVNYKSNQKNVSKRLQNNIRWKMPPKTEDLAAESSVGSH